jgi:CspA family cold shock protein
MIDMTQDVSKKSSKTTPLENPTIGENSAKDGVSGEIKPAKKTAKSKVAKYTSAKPTSTKPASAKPASAKPASAIAKAVKSTAATAKISENETPQNKDDAAETSADAGDPNVEVSKGSLVWYNERKGYGFVRIGVEEVFLHRSTLDRFGLVRLLTGDQITVSLSTNEHGRVIKDLLAVERPLGPSPPVAIEPEDGEVPAIVKFFNDLRGYGFVTAENMEEDAFVHSRVLNNCGFHSLIQGQKLLVRVDDTGRGLQVNSVRLLAE